MNLKGTEKDAVSTLHSTTWWKCPMRFTCTSSFVQWELGIFPHFHNTHIYLYSVLELYLYLCICLLKAFNSKTTEVSHCISKKKKKDQLGDFWRTFFSFFPGDIYKEEIWVNEEGLWAECSVWLWDCSDHLQQHQQTVPVCQHWHGQSVAEIYRVQWAAWESNKFGYRWGKILRSPRILLLLCSGTEVLKARGLTIFLKGCRTYPGGDIAAGDESGDKGVLVWGLQGVQQRLEGIHVFSDLPVSSRRVPRGQQKRPRWDLRLPVVQLSVLLCPIRPPHASAAASRLNLPFVS